MELNRPCSAAAVKSVAYFDSESSVERRCRLLLWALAPSDTTIPVNKQSDRLSAVSNRQLVFVRIVLTLFMPGSRDSRSKLVTIELPPQPELQGSCQRSSAHVWACFREMWMAGRRQPRQPERSVNQNDSRFGGDSKVRICSPEAVGKKDSGGVNPLVV